MKKHIGAATLALVLACGGATASWAQVAGGTGGPSNPASRQPTYYNYYGSGMGPYGPPPPVYYDYYGYYGMGPGPLNGAVQPAAKYPSPAGGWAGN